MIHNGSRGLTHPSHRLHSGVTQDLAVRLRADVRGFAAWQRRPRAASTDARGTRPATQHSRPTAPRLLLRRRRRTGRSGHPHRRRSRGQRLPLSQAALAEQVRAQGHDIANNRLRWLAPPVAWNRIRSRRERVPGSAAGGAAAGASRGAGPRSGRPAQRQRAEAHDGAPPPATPPTSTGCATTTSGENSPNCATCCIPNSGPFTPAEDWAPAAATPRPHCTARRFANVVLIDAQRPGALMGRWVRGVAGVAGGTRHRRDLAARTPRQHRWDAAVRVGHAAQPLRIIFGTTQPGHGSPTCGTFRRPPGRLRRSVRRGG